MPTAQSFTALGAGNGFPFCPDKVDVTEEYGGVLEFPHWTTASGFNHNSGGMPDAASIEESRRLTMLAFWNTYQLNATAAGAGASASNPTTPWGPKDRICFDASRGISDYGSSENGTAFVSMPIGVVALYKGSTDDPDLFLGYGIDGAYCFSDDGYELLLSEVTCGALAYINTTPYDNGYEAYDRQYTTISIGGESIHVVGEAYAENYSPNADDVTISATGLTADATQGTSASISSITPYTY